MLMIFLQNGTTLAIIRSGKVRQQTKALL